MAHSGHQLDRAALFLSLHHQPLLLLNVGDLKCFDSQFNRNFLIGRLNTADTLVSGYVNPDKSGGEAGAGCKRHP